MRRHVTEVEALAMRAAENGQRRMRVLVEAPAQPWHFTVREAQELEHCDVTFCGGPAEGHGPCPITVGRACRFGSDFDVVVMTHAGHFPMLERPTEFDAHLSHVVSALTPSRDQPLTGP